MRKPSTPYTFSLPSMTDASLRSILAVPPEGNKAIAKEAFQVTLLEVVAISRRVKCPKRIELRISGAMLNSAIKSFRSGFNYALLLLRCAFVFPPRLPPANPKKKLKSRMTHLGVPVERCCLTRRGNSSRKVGLDRSRQNRQAAHLLEARKEARRLPCSQHPVVRKKSIVYPTPDPEPAKR
jgi:hypothetical protein